MKRVAFLFPGQGDQNVGMGKDFFDAFIEAKEVYQEADELLQEGLSKIVFEGPESLLTETKNSQVGIYTTSMSVLKVIQKQFPSLKPSVVSGLSLGEYSALTAAGAFSFSKGIPLVRARGQFMNDACYEKKGAMAAILGLDFEAVEKMVKELNLPQDLWVANLNSPGQVVISGTEKGVEIGSIKAKEIGAKRAIPLPVFGAFHSGLMKSAEERLRPLIDELSIATLTSRIVMNVPGDFVVDPQLIKENMIKQVTSSVRWAQGIKAMQEEIDLFIEVGCGSTLAGLNKRIGVLAPTISVNKVQDLEKLAEGLK